MPAAERDKLQRSFAARARLEELERDPRFMSRS